MSHKLKYASKNPNEALEIVQHINKQISILAKTDQDIFNEILCLHRLIKIIIMPTTNTTTTSITNTTSQNIASSTDELIPRIDNIQTDIVNKYRRISHIILNNTKSSNDKQKKESIRRRLSKLDVVGEEILEKVTGLNQDERIATFITKLLYNNDTKEGKSRIKFIKNFKNFEKSPSLIPQMIQQFLTAFIDHLCKSKQVQNYAKIIYKFNDDDEFKELFADVIYKTVEGSLLEPLKDILNQIVYKNTKNKDIILLKKISILNQKSQAYFGIRKKCISESHWKSATYILSQLNKKNETI